MSVVTQTSYLSVTIDGHEINCQIIDAKFKPPGFKTGNQVQTACPDGTVTDVGEAVPGSLTGTVFTDTSHATTQPAKPAGVTYQLAKLFQDRTEFDYVYKQFPNTDHEISWSGRAKVTDFEIDHERPGYAKHPISLEITTAALAAQTTTP